MKNTYQNIQYKSENPLYIHYRELSPSHTLWKDAYTIEKVNPLWNDNYYNSIHIVICLLSLELLPVTREHFFNIF